VQSFELPLKILAPWALHHADTDSGPHHAFRSAVSALLEGSGDDEEPELRWVDSSILLVRICVPNTPAEGELELLAKVLGQALEMGADDGESITVGRFLAVPTRGHHTFSPLEHFPEDPSPEYQGHVEPGEPGITEQAPEESVPLPGAEEDSV
jgi:hypothetical protein